MRHRALVTATVTMLSLVAFAPASSALPAEPGGPDLAQRLATQNIKWAPCFQQAPAAYKRLQCATIKAPLDWKKPNGKKINLSISRLKARKKAKGVVFTNPGGPGAPGWTVPLMFVDAGRNRLLNTMDIIGIDVRGTGYSTQASCKRISGKYLDYRNRSAANTKQLLARTKKVANACRNSGNKKLPSKYVTTAQTVHDLEWIRRNLRTSGNKKVNKIHWIGYSAGTWLGAYYARKWPKRTGRFVLDSVVDFTSSWRVSDDAQPKAFQKRFRTFAGWAAKYDAQYGLGTSQKAVVNRYEQIRKAIADAGRIQVIYDDGQPGYFYATDLDYLISQALYSKWSFTGLAQDLNTLSGILAQGQARAVTPRLSLAVDPQAGSSPTYLNITCNDTAFGRTPAKHAAWTKKNGAANPLVGYGQITNPCSQWKRPSGQLKLPRPSGRGLPKLLLVHAKGDPATAYGEAVRARKRYKNSRLITVNNEGDHGIYGGGNSCVDKAVEKYLIDGVYPKRDSSCKGQPLPVPDANGNRSQQQFNPLQRFQELGELTRN